MSLYDNINILPMLIGEEKEVFSNKNFLFELKFDGERCLAYLDKNETLLINKRGVKMLPKVPELANIHKQIKIPCIIDGELMILKNGKPDFFEIQKRSLTSNVNKIKLLSNEYPASFTAFDILYLNKKSLLDEPLYKRKEILIENLKPNDSLGLSNCFENKGYELFDFALKNNLEGVVAKRKDSIYTPGKRTKDWIKIKCLQDDDFIIIGFKEGNADSNLSSIILGQYNNNNIEYCSSVAVGKNSEVFKKVKKLKDSVYKNIKPIPTVVFKEPVLVCTVKFMMRTKNGGLRQPVFKGLRDDKSPKECIYKSI